MNKQNPDPPKDQFPPTNHLAAAIKKLPTPGPNVLPQTVEIDAGPADGRYSVTFVVRRNPALSKPTWFWGVDSSERIPALGANGEIQDPD